MEGVAASEAGASGSAPTSASACSPVALTLHLQCRSSGDYSMCSSQRYRLIATELAL